MTKIKNYELDSTINDDDKVIGTDGLPGPNFGRTKNYSIGSLVTYIQNQFDPVGGSGTLNTIPIWTPDGDTLGDSIIIQNQGAITVAGGLGVTGNASITGHLDVSLTSTFLGDVFIGEGLKDAADSYGTANQLLTSTGTQTSWQDFSTLVPNNITGSGTLNTIAMFTPDGTAVGDSIIIQNPGAITVDGGLGVTGNASITGHLDVALTSTFLGDVFIGEGLKDASDSYGTANQLLTSTGTQTSWQDFSAIVPNNIYGGGTLNTIPLFTPDGQTIGDSIITQNPDASAITINGDLTVDGVSVTTQSLTVEGVCSFYNDVEISSNLEVDGFTGLHGGLTVDESTTLNGDLTVQGGLTANDPVTINSTLTANDPVTINSTLTANGNITLGDSTADTTTIDSTLVINGVVRDSNQTLGADGQILVANEASELLWQDQDGNTTYSVSSQQASSDVEIILAGSDVTESQVTLVAGNSISLTDDGSNNITIAATGGAANTTYSLNNVQGATTTDLQLVGSDATADSYRFEAGTGVSFDQTVVGVTTIDFDTSALGNVFGSGDLNHFALWSPDGQTLDTSPFSIESFTPFRAKLRGNDAKLSIQAVGYGNAILTFEPNISGNNLGVFEMVDPLLATPNTKFVWQKGGSEFMRLDTVTGNLAVGTTQASSFRVQVDGSAGFAADDNGIPYFQVYKYQTGALTFLETGINGGTINIGAPTDYEQNIYVQGTGKFRDGIKDISDSVGTASQLLSSTGSGVQWVDLSTLLVPNNIITGSGTLNQIPIWTPDGDTLGDSIIFQDTDAGVITVDGGLGVTGNAGISGNLDVSLTSTFLGDVFIGEGLKDATDSYGTANQLLTSTGTQTSWQDFSTLVPNNITGSGTLNTIAMFTPDGTAVGDSIILQDIDAGTITVGGNTVTNGTVQIDTLNSGFIPYNNPQGILADSVIVQNVAGNRIDINADTLINGNADVTGNLDVTLTATFEGDVSLREGLKDASNSYGTANQLLTSTGTQTSWQDFSTLVPNNITGSGTLNTIPIWTPDGDTLGDSIILQDIDAGTITVDGGLGVTGNADITGNAGITGNLDVTLTSTFEGDVSLGEGLKDASDSYGTANQLLTSTGTQTSWQDFSTLVPNNVSGTGTENFGALWGAGGTVLTDSLLKHGTGVDSIGIGLNNDTQGLESIAFTRSTSISNYSFALGYESITDGEFSVTLGKGTYTAGRHAMATNYKSLALGQSSFAGGHTSATGGDGAVALGHNASAGNFGAAKLVATFPNDQTTFDIEGIVGTVEAGLFMRYGENLDVPDPRIEILTFTDNGNNSATLTVAAPGIRPIQGELVVFEEAIPFRGDHQGGVALGNDAYSLGEGTVSIGHTSVAEADKAVALGDAAKSSGASSVAIGKNATVTSEDTIALGGDSTKILMKALAASSSYADDVAAAAGGVAIGELYRNGNIVQIRLT